MKKEIEQILNTEYFYSEDKIHRTNISEIEINKLIISALEKYILQREYELLNSIYSSPIREMESVVYKEKEKRLENLRNT